MHDIILFMFKQSEGKRSEKLINGKDNFECDPKLLSNPLLAQFVHFKTDIMRLLTHNFLQSNVKHTENGYPLDIEAEKVVLEASPIDKDLVLKLWTKLDYTVLRNAVQQLSSSPASSEWQVQLPELPNVVSLDELEQDDTLLSQIHTVLMDVHLLEGSLVCPDTGRKFPVKGGIPNMILHEDEV
jgi:multifunctional methyltransferase subunit TRM112